MRRTWPGPATTRSGWRAVDDDAIVLDLMLPGRDGVEVCRLLRERCLVARPHADSSRRGRGSRGRPRRGRRRLPAEAVLLRRAPRPPARARSPGWSRGRPCSRSATSGLDPATRQAWRGETEIQVSGKEFALLETFMRRPGQVLSRLLLEHAWDIGYENRSNVVDVYVRYLRDKVDRPFGRTTLETVRGVGYRPRRGRVSRLPVRIRLTSRSPLRWPSCWPRSARSSTCGSATPRGAARREPGGAAGTLAALVREQGADATSPPETTKPSPRSVDSTARRSSPRRRLSERATAPSTSRATSRASTGTGEASRHAGRRRGASSSLSERRLEDRQEALDGLLAQLFVVGPLALLLTAVALHPCGRGAATRRGDAAPRRRGLQRARPGSVSRSRRRTTRSTGSARP